jgi:hypothetical protein
MIGLLTAIAGPALAEWRDPTIPGNFSSGTPANPVNSDLVLDVSEILITETRKQAIINGMIVTTGDYLNDATRVLKIAPGHVLIQQQGSIKKLYLVPSVKKPLK